ncbi:MAG: shikimate dehydrogenase [Desulfobacterales bacterium]|nr:shikimate dehydrogenase [Desulfobacterales bacterium]
MTQISPSTKLFAVFGNPVGHSMSPQMHNAAFAYQGIDAVYLAFAVDDAVKAILAMKALSIGGASVTIPFKEEVMELLDEIDPLAQRIGAVNTVLNRNGRLIGYNTDGMGATQALTDKVILQNRSVCILGAGGAARSVAYGLREKGAHVIICNRSVDRGKKLADELSVSFYPLSAIDSFPCDILVNTTSVGMLPNVLDIPVPESMLHPNMVVMDIVYNPLKTALLKAAEIRGCTIIDGLSMFVYQGAFQFELWTQIQAPLEVMRNAVLQALTKHK